jgi:hypothetical protein
VPLLRSVPKGRQLYFVFIKVELGFDYLATRFRGLQHLDKTVHVAFVLLGARVGLNKRGVQCLARRLVITHSKRVGHVVFVFR